MYGALRLLLDRLINTRVGYQNTTGATRTETQRTFRCISGQAGRDGETGPPENVETDDDKSSR